MSNSNTENLDSIYDSKDYKDRKKTSWSFVIFFILLFVCFIVIVLLVLYYLYWKPIIPSQKCENNTTCGINQVCSAGYCQEIICKTEKDCNGNGLCINSYCTPYTCRIGNDCPDGTACVRGSQLGSESFNLDQGVCLKVGDKCSSNANCNNLSCMNEVCSQCLSNSNCSTGQGCFNQSCRYPYEGETGANMLYYNSLAQEHGNITAPPGYFCTATVCGTGINNQEKIDCSGTGTCPNSCSSCINSVCRCTKGEVFEGCKNNIDCISGVCSTVNGEKICIESGGECLYNYDGEGGDGICTVSSPYCVNGKCSSVSLGAPCGAVGMPEDLCNNPQALGVPGQTGISKNGMGFFCVNGICQQGPGQLNSLCTTGSCGFIEEDVLVCLPVETQSINEMRCLVNLFG